MERGAEIGNGVGISFVLSAPLAGHPTGVDIHRFEPGRVLIAIPTLSLPLPPPFQDSMALKPLVHRTKREGQLKRIPRRFHQIALQIRFCRWPHINVVRFRWPGFLPTHFRRLIKRQFREFPQQSRIRRDHLLFLRLIQIRKRVLRKLPQHLCRHSAFKLAFAKHREPCAANRIRNCPQIHADGSRFGKQP